MLVLGLPKDSAGIDYCPSQMSNEAQPSIATVGK